MVKTRRLNKALAQAGVCSRRKADQLIFSGQVRVNGQVCTTPGTQVQIQDQIEVSGQLIDIGAPELVYLAMNKPTQVICSLSDPQGRTTIVDLLPPKWRQTRVVPVGRLDFMSQGLLLLTNDGDLHYRLTHPKFHLPKTYHVLIRGHVNPHHLTLMRAGMVLEDKTRLAPIKVKILSSSKQGTWMEMILYQGINRQIRRMMQEFNLTILKLIRTSQGKVRLGTLPLGTVRPLQAPEIQALKQAVATFN